MIKADPSFPSFTVLQFYQFYQFYFSFEVPRQVFQGLYSPAPGKTIGDGTLSPFFF
jgi:hypothetical protein